MKTWPERTTKEPKPSDSGVCLFPQVCDMRGSCQNWLINHEGCVVVAARKAEQENEVSEQQNKIQTLEISDKMIDLYHLFRKRNPESGLTLLGWIHAELDSADMVRWYWKPGRESSNAMYLKIARVVDEFHPEKDHRDSDFDVLPGGVRLVIEHYKERAEKAEAQLRENGFISEVITT